MRKVGILFTSTALSLGLATSVVHAQTQVGSQQDKIAIEVQSAETNVSKTVFIKKLKDLFPNQFNFLSENDFQLSNAHHYPDDERIRYDLSFHKTVDGKEAYGSVTFVGTDLEIESFYYEPVNVKEALFPPKISKDEAQEIALNLIKKLPNGTNYELDKNLDNYYSNQLITDPIRYEFTFVQKVNNIPVQDKRIQITVLGNGEITQLYHFSSPGDKATFDDSKKVISEQTILQKIKNNLSVNLKYRINYDYSTGEQAIDLVYQPTVLYGINALSGDWQTANGFSKNPPIKANIEKLTANPLPPKENGITVEEARAIAKQLLEIDSEKVKLTIFGVDEYENENGQAILNINFSYDWEYGGFGSSFEMNKSTGEILNYHDVKSEVLRNLGETPEKGDLTQDQGEQKAIEYLKQWVPSYLHQYAKPIDEPYLDKESGVYHFTFPRVVNGILVDGNHISVSIDSNGELYSLFVHHQEKGDWPSVSNIISADNAKQLITDSLSLKLQYMKDGSNPNSSHYSIVYTPIYNGDESSFLDATTGKWNSLYQNKEFERVTHPTAEEELNYLIQNEILKVADVSQFNADASISNGEALSILVKSLSYFYVYEVPQQENINQTFENISPNHPYYQIVERAVRMGILDSKDSFNPNDTLTREQLAVWYVRTLGLDLAARNSNIFKLTIADANKVNSKYVGYVALANAMEVLPAKNNLFDPKGEVTYADIASSIFDLSHKLHERVIPITPYY